MGIETAIGAALITSTVGAAASLAGSAMTNDANTQIAKTNNATMIELANTSHQREVADLKAAGLNPILSAGGSGSSTPSLQAPTLTNALGDAMREGITNFSALQSAKQYDPLVDKTKSETALNKALTLKAAADTSSAVAAKNNIEAKTAQEQYGALGKALGTRASELFGDVLPKSDDSGLVAKIRDIVTNINVNSAKKQAHSARDPSSFSSKVHDFFYPKRARPGATGSW